MFATKNGNLENGTIYFDILCKVELVFDKDKCLWNKVEDDSVLNRSSMEKTIFQTAMLHQKNLVN